jgi:imidazolonepropionase-like amidohydrolase
MPGLAEGAPADLVVYDIDPRRDLTAVMLPRRMVLRGRVVM